MSDKYVSKINTPFGERFIKAVALATDLWTTLTNTFKPKQTAVPSPSASGSGVQFIDQITQDENGVITPHKRVITDASQSNKGLMSAEDKKKLDNITSPLQWKGTAIVAQLNAGITGIQPGWTYTLTDAGTLTDGSIAVEAGDEVAWTEGDEWFKVGNDSKTLVKDEAIGLEYVPGQPYMSGNVVMYQGIRYVCNSNHMDEEWDPSHWTLRPVGVDIERLQKAIGSIKNGGALTDAATVNVPNNALSTLVTAQATLTLNVNMGADDVPNFAVEVIPSVDCTLTVTKTVGTGRLPTELTPSVAGGTSLATGKKYQLTCVGSCWTLAEFTLPTP